MEYKLAMHTDIGPEKASNQDSMCAKEAFTPQGSVLLAAICDGMGGLEKGELASKTMAQALSDWFERELPLLLASQDYRAEICDSLDALVKRCSARILAYGSRSHIQLGTTVTAIVFLPDNSYIICHVGDTRIYRIGAEGAALLTEDQTLVQRELRLGRITREQARVDPRGNVLLQCVGASKYVQPVFIHGNALPGESYLLCSDGFRHEITRREIGEAFSPEGNTNEVVMKRNIVSLVEKNIACGETDNISAMLIRTM